MPEATPEEDPAEIKLLLAEDPVVAKEAWPLAVAVPVVTDERMISVVDLSTVDIAVPAVTVPEPPITSVVVSEPTTAFVVVVPEAPFDDSVF
jgi:hypothetical protein